MADQVFHGGLMRCCVQSLLEDPKYGNGKEGDRTECRWCKGGIVFKDGGWRWAGPEDDDHGSTKK